MAIIKTVEGKTPRWGKNCFIAENAVLTGDCILGDDCSIWYSAVLRSDVDAISGCYQMWKQSECAGLRMHSSDWYDALHSGG